MMRVFNGRITASLLVLAALLLELMGMEDRLQVAAQDLPRGRVVRNVVCRANPNQSYALYLPHGYSRDRRWPILYAFDAGARGVLPVERFRAAAERYGYIVVGSNNSRDGPIAIADEALNAILTDTRSRFAVDEKRIYVTGFSGGARVAALAGVALKAAGVIGSGAGFHASLQPSSSLPFAYLGTVGTGDFNYPELTQLDEALGRAGVPHRLEVFEGGHDWAPADVCMHAIEWMEVQAIRKSVRPSDARLLDDILQGAIAEAGANERSGRLDLAFDRYSAIVSEFAGLRDVAQLERKVRELRSAEQVKRMLAARRDSIAAQQSTEARIGRLITQVLSGRDRQDALPELAMVFAEFRRQSNEPRESVARMVARRVLTSAWVQLGEAASKALTLGNAAQAAVRLELMALIRPDSYQVYYDLARALARDGQKKAAITALLIAVNSGFNDLPALESEPDFANLVGDDEFRALVSRLKTPASGRGRTSAQC
jgi:dienelactone hydrolase